MTVLNQASPLPSVMTIQKSLGLRLRLRLRLRLGLTPKMMPEAEPDWEEEPLLAVLPLLLLLPVSP